MEQRQLRLGDVLDDYCPRERRLTNHAVVAMIGDTVRQTRCLTCDTEHVYKAAKVPARRKRKDVPAALYAEVLAGLAEPATPAPRAQLARPAPALDNLGREEPGDAGLTEPPGEPDPSLASGPVAREDGPAHRPLIRATLPRIEGQQPQARPLPEFTVRQSGQRNGQARGMPPHRTAGGRPNGPQPGGRPSRGRGGRSSGGQHGPDRSMPHAGRPRRQFAPHGGRKRSK